MTLPRWLPVAGLAAVAWLAWLGVQKHLRDDGALRYQQHVLAHENDSLRAVGRGLDTVYVHRTDTLRLTRRVTDSILTVDTLIRADTVRLMVERERLACDAVVATCEEQKANLRSQLANMTRQLEVEQARRGSWLGRTAGKVLWFGAGLGVGAVLK